MKRRKRKSNFTKFKREALTWQEARNARILWRSSQRHLLSQVLKFQGWAFSIANPLQDNLYTTAKPPRDNPFWSVDALLDASYPRPKIPWDAPQSQIPDLVRDSETSIELHQTLKSSSGLSPSPSSQLPTSSSSSKWSQLKRKLPKTGIGLKSSFVRCKNKLTIKETGSHSKFTKRRNCLRLRWCNSRGCSSRISRKNFKSKAYSDHFKMMTSKLMKKFWVKMFQKLLISFRSLYKNLLLMPKERKQIWKSEKAW